MNSDRLFDDLGDLAETPGVYCVLGIDKAALIVIFYVRVLFELLEFFIQSEILNFEFFLDLHWLCTLSYTILLSGCVTCGCLRWVHLSM